MESVSESKNNYYWLAIPLIILVGLVGYYFMKKNNPEVQNSSLTTPSPSVSISAVEELKIEDITVGTGAEAVSGKKITVNYSGTLTNGTKFDSSYDRGTPFSFTLGAGQVIQGWDKGFAGMKIGGKRRLTIPSSMGYGATGAGGVIPPNATLIFEVELLKVE
jgi:FKBP-type peptidyl-prolyl cis-trans isomerase